MMRGEGGEDHGTAREREERRREGGREEGWGRGGRKSYCVISSGGMALACVIMKMSGVFLYPIYIRSLLAPRSEREN